MSWRDHIKVHPAADLFPMMSEPELRELGEDIKKNKQRVQIIFWIPAGRRAKRGTGSGCTAAMLSRSCPLWVKSRHTQCIRACPLYPQ
jgi:hypothetical protein